MSAPLIVDGFYTKVVEIEECFVRLRYDGIVHVYYKEKTVIDPELQERTIKIFREITGGARANFIFEGAEDVVFTKEARDNSLKLERENTVIHASAIIVKNLAGRIVANFFIRINHPRIKYKAFSSVDDAIAWLTTLKIEL